MLMWYNDGETEISDLTAPLHTAMTRSGVHLAEGTTKNIFSVWIKELVQQYDMCIEKEGECICILTYVYKTCNLLLLF